MSIQKEGVLEKMKGTDSVVLNVLPEEEYLKMHIQGSFSIPLRDDRKAFAQEVEEKFGKEKLFITYASNITSYVGIHAAQALLDKGFRAETYLSGMREWRQAGWPSEGTEAPPQAIFP